MRKSPYRPTHLELDLSVTEPLVVLERIEDGQGEEFKISGPLVKFPRSPQINFDVYAIRLSDSDGVQRNVTFMTDFSSAPKQDLFFEIKDKLENAWNSLEDQAEYDRNKFVNRKIIVTAKGIKNVTDPSQANAQIFIDKIEDVEIRIY